MKPYNNIVLTKESLSVAWMWEHTNKRAMVIMRALTAIPANPMRWRVLRPALSTKKS